MSRSRWRVEVYEPDPGESFLFEFSFEADEARLRSVLRVDPDDPLADLYPVDSGLLEPFGRFIGRALSNDVDHFVV